MSAFAIDVFNFEFWDGPPPAIPTQKVISTHRPGVSGVSHHLLGTWGDTFSCTLTSHWSDFFAATEGHRQMVLLIGTGGKYVKFNNLNWSMLHSVLYNVEAVDIADLRAAIYLAGPGYAYPNGASLVTRFTLTPQAV
jgi:hypothetical protein